MKRMNDQLIAAINSARLFSAQEHPCETHGLRPWQAVQMEYERVGLQPPANIPDFQTMEDAEIWMCLDRQYNLRLRETSWSRAC